LLVVGFSEAESAKNMAGLWAGQKMYLQVSTEIKL